MNRGQSGFLSQFRGGGLTGVAGSLAFDGWWRCTGATEVVGIHEVAPGVRVVDIVEICLLINNGRPLCWQMVD
ncbi:MAG: hypothetical protein SNJ75_04880 [Gemmataceae bacterium]